MCLVDVKKKENKVTGKQEVHKQNMQNESQCGAEERANVNSP